ncbi:MAG: poly-gamma-glutamate biosynthesis protein PgsC/CapC, partial [Candidatus Competibacterales bacterium]|nr:poly-gamma-glutamate biosynthesis protein PgsC/CapC [Candidatus Competibacterales bacterium]
MDLLPLEIFPLGLSSSVITTVWIGVLVVAFFNLRLGWVLSGLVVPGYLVPLLLINPWSAAVITGEAVVTYLLVHAFSERWSRLGFWSGLFGRDRFFALVLVSVIVRLVFDGWLLPLVGAYWAEHFDSSFDYRNNLHSFGLVIIALMANQFWKPGLLRGLVPLVVTVGITYLIVRYGLLAFTNFNVGQLGFLYEDLAASILASPKAYIVLLTTAFIASRMNLLYGWDFNGILIPSLLALQWYQPSKILTSFGEAFLILLLARLLLATPVFSRITMEGARKLVFFFNIGFAYKLLLAYALSRLAPEIKVTDAFAFGYLLSTLIAMRMHDHHVVARLTRASLQTSLVAVAVASVVGFGLTLLPLSRALLPETAAVTRVEVVERPDLAPLELLQRDQLALYQAQTRGHIPQP